MSRKDFQFANRRDFNKWVRENVRKQFIKNSSRKQYEFGLYGQQTNYDNFIWLLDKAGNELIDDYDVITSKDEQTLFLINDGQVEFYTDVVFDLIDYLDKNKLLK